MLPAYRQAGTNVQHSSFFQHLICYHILRRYVGIMKKNKIRKFKEPLAAVFFLWKLIIIEIK